MAPPHKRKSEYVSDEFVVDDDSERPSKKTKTPFLTNSAPKVDTDGNQYWEISKARRVTLSEFKGTSLVNIREYYQKDGEWLPGKKGISMTVEQYSTFISVLPQIEQALQKKGEDVPRPEYNSGQAMPQPASSEEDDLEPETEKKANIEATSDEED